MKTSSFKEKYKKIEIKKKDVNSKILFCAR